MKRRQALRSLLSLPALTALPAAAQQAAEKTDKTKPPSSEKVPAELKPAPLNETAPLAMTAPDTVVESAPGFFSAADRANLTRLAALIVPSVDGKPGAVEAGVPAFLDFLVCESPANVQQLYQKGLSGLERQSQQLFGKPFHDLPAAEAARLLAPLDKPWTFTGPSDPVARFLITAREDLLHATLNSREWAQSSTGRRAGGRGQYWLPVE